MFGVYIAFLAIISPALDKIQAITTQTKKHTDKVNSWFPLVSFLCRSIPANRVATIRAIFTNIPSAQP